MGDKMRWRGLGFFIISYFICSVCSVAVQVKPGELYPDTPLNPDDPIPTLTECSMTSASCIGYTSIPNCSSHTAKKGPDGNCYSTCDVCDAGYVKGGMFKIISYGTNNECTFTYNGCKKPPCSTDGDCGDNEKCVATSCVCAAGYERGMSINLNGSAGCVPCGVGYFKEGQGDDKCKPCPAGSHSAEGKRGMGSTSCELCEMGSYNDETGLGACMQCPNGGTTDDEGAESITDCYIKKDREDVIFEDEYGSGTLTVTADCYAE